MHGLSLSYRDLPDELISTHQLESRVITQSENAEKEIRFLWREADPVLPCWLGEQLVILPWGNRSKECTLPKTGWACIEDLERGLWRNRSPERVELPCSMALCNGVWFGIQEGIHGIAVTDEEETQRIYMLTEESTHYFHVMTRSERMPMLVNQTI